VRMENGRELSREEAHAEARSRGEEEERKRRKEEKKKRRKEEKKKRRELATDWHECTRMGKRGCEDDHAEARSRGEEEKRRRGEEEERKRGREEKKKRRKEEKKKRRELVTDSHECARMGMSRGSRGGAETRRKTTSEERM